MSRDVAIERIADASVGVLAFRRGGRPAACAITPLVDGDHPVVTSTLAYTRKMEHLRLDGRVALMAGGVVVDGVATVTPDVRGARFTSSLVGEEVRKYPPTGQLRALPGHRRLAWWYFGRVIADIAVDHSWDAGGDDRRTVATLDRRGWPTIARLPDGIDLSGDRLRVPVPDGPAVILEHHESDDGSRLAQLIIDGDVADGTMLVRRRRGGVVVPDAASIWQQWRQLSAMRRLGIDGRAAVAGWT